MLTTRKSNKPMSPAAEVAPKEVKTVPSLDVCLTTDRRSVSIMYGAKSVEIPVTEIDFMHIKLTEMNERVLKNT